MVETASASEVGPPASIETAARHLARTAIDELVARGIGTVVIEGESGLGKSDLLLAYQSAAESRGIAAPLFTRPEFDLPVLLDAISDALVGPFAPRLDLESLVGGLKDGPFAGRKTVLLIDNAERLGKRAWRAVALLAGLDAPGLTLVLAGRPPFAARFEKMRKGAAGTGARVILPPLTVPMAVDFIQQVTARSAPDQTIRPEAMRALAAAAAGLPDRLCKLTAATLAAGYEAHEQPITLATALRVAAQKAAPGFKRGRLLAAASVCTAAVLVAGAFLWRAGTPVQAELPKAVAAATGMPAEAVSAIAPAAKAAPIAPAVPVTPAMRVDEAVAALDVFILPARRGDRLRTLYADAYRGGGPKASFEQFLQANPGTPPDSPLAAGQLVSFPGPFGSP